MYQIYNRLAQIIKKDRRTRILTTGLSNDQNYKQAASRKHESKEINKNRAKISMLGKRSIYLNYHTFQKSNTELYI